MDNFKNFFNMKINSESLLTIPELNAEKSISNDNKFKHRPKFIDKQ